MPRWKQPGRTYTHIRVTAETHQRLLAEIDLLVAAVDMGYTACDSINPDPMNPITKQISIDSMIGIMLDDRLAHRARRKKSAEKRRGGRRGEAVVDTPPPDQATGASGH